jgi:hypothetical protein
METRKMQQKEIRIQMLDQAASMYAQAVLNIGDASKARRNTFQRILQTFGHPYWMNRNNIKYLYTTTILQNDKYETVVNNPPPEGIVVEV